LKGTIPESEVLEYLERKKNVLDGVVITGGEPMVQNDLKNFIQKVKKIGLLVKLDTNGSSPQLLKEFIEEGLIDYVAMDIKGPVEKYKLICGYLKKEFIQESVNLIINSGLDYEFRTTVLPYYHSREDFYEIGELLRGARRYAIQGFRPEIVLDKTLEGSERFTKEQLSDFASIMAKYVDNVVVHDNY
jgi:pyruvate formate lyase activating enzyme